MAEFAALSARNPGQTRGLAAIPADSPLRHQRRQLHHAGPL